MQPKSIYCHQLFPWVSFTKKNLEKSTNQKKSSPPLSIVISFSHGSFSSPPCFPELEKPSVIVFCSKKGDPETYMSLNHCHHPCTVTRCLKNYDMSFNTIFFACNNEVVQYHPVSSFIIEDHLIQPQCDLRELETRARGL